MQIKINNKVVKAQILPVDKPTLDETLETFSFVLVSDDNPMPYAPCQKVQVITNDNEKINLFLVSDNVEIFSVSPTRYKHNITCVQNTRKLSKHLVRNSSFTTPPYLEKRAYSAITSCIKTTPVSGSTDHIYSYDFAPICENNNIEEAVTLRNVNGYTREKVKSAYFYFKIQGCKRETYSSPFTWQDNITDISTVISESTPLFANFQFHNNLVLKYTNASNQDITETIDPATLGAINNWYPLDRKVKFNRVMELASQGCNNFSIIFDGSPVTGSYQSGNDHAEVYPFFCFQAHIILETYYYNAYEILDLLLWRQMKQRKIDGTFINEDPLFRLRSNDELATLLKNTPAPNFVFTQCTMYECLAEVFRLFDAIFTMDEDGYLGIEYFNEANGRDVTSTLKKVGQNSSSSEDKYTNGLVAYYQNAKSVREFPSVKGMNASIKSKEIGVPASDNSFIFETDNNIDEVIEAYVSTPRNLRIKLGSDLTERNIGPGSGVSLNVSKYIINQELWTLLDMGKDLIAPSTLQQINTVFFKKGTKEIDVSYTYKRYWLGTTQFAFNNMNDSALARQFGIRNYVENAYVLIDEDTTPTWNNYGLKIKYIANTDGRVKIESIDRKYDGETLVDQYNGAVDLNKMGLNILGLTLKLGNPTLTVTQKICKWQDRIKVGDIYNYEGKTWIANVVAYTLLGDGNVQATIQFVQNFNALAMRTQLLREKRMSNISNELTTKSEENIVEYVYFETRQGIVGGTPGFTREPISFNYTALINTLSKSLGDISDNQYNLYPTVEMAYIIPSNTSNIYHIPLVKYGSGNSMCFEVSYNDPMAVGKQTKAYGSNVWFDKSYFTKMVKYTDENGEFPSVTIGFAGDVRISSMPLSNFPILNGFIADTFIFIDSLQYQKQPNEIFALNYELCFLPMDSTKDFIGSKFINNNYLVDGTIRVPNDLKVYYRNDDFKYSVLDTKGSGSTTTVNSVTCDIFGQITFFLNRRIEATSVAICESDGTILFASNRPFGSNQFVLHFTTSHYRQDKKMLDEY